MRLEYQNQKGKHTFQKIKFNLLDPHLHYSKTELFCREILEVEYRLHFIFHLKLIENLKVSAESQDDQQE